MLMSADDRTRWNERYATDREPRAPSRVLTALDAFIPRRGRAIDLAGGTGRHAIWLAERGLDVTLFDVSDVAIEIAAQHARARGVNLQCVRRDLEVDGIPGEPWDLVLSFHYRERSLMPRFANVLAPGGRLIFVQPTRSNLARHAKPSARFLLDDGELPSLVTGLDVIRYDEGWLEEGRHEARIVAERSAHHA